MTIVRTVSHSLTTTLLLAALSVPALAQSPAAAQEPPKPACTKPGDFPGNVTGSDRQKRAWIKEVNDYLTCIKKFADDQQALAQLHVNAATAAINEYNNVVKTTNELVK